MKTNRIFKMMKLSSLSIYETADTRHSLNKFALCSRLTTVFIFALSSFIFDFVEVATLAVCVNKFPPTRSLATLTSST